NRVGPVSTTNWVRFGREIPDDGARIFTALGKHVHFATGLLQPKQCHFVVVVGNSHDVHLSRQIARITFDYLLSTSGTFQSLHSSRFVRRAGLTPNAANSSRITRSTYFTADAGQTTESCLVKKSSSGRSRTMR